LSTPDFTNSTPCQRRPDDLAATVRVEKPATSLETVFGQNQTDQASALIAILPPQRRNQQIRSSAKKGLEASDLRRAESTHLETKSC